MNPGPPALRSGDLPQAGILARLDDGPRDLCSETVYG